MMSIHKGRDNLRRKWVRLLGVCVLLWAVTGARAKPETNAPVGFREHLIATLPGVYQCAVADINGDGKPDILGLSSGKNEIAWYENPTWQKHIVTTATRGNIDLATYDIDGDGKLELAIASAFDLNNTQQGGRLQWFARRGRKCRVGGA